MPPSPDTVLILCGAEARLSITLARDGAPAAHQQWLVPGRAMQFLAPAAEAMLAGLDLSPRDLGGVACVRGPGGFTGVRLTLATALGLSLGAGLPMAGLDYLELLASEPVALFGLPVAVVTHSRRREVYYREFAADGKMARGLAPAEAVGVEEAAKRAARLIAAGPARLVGSGLRRNVDAFAGLPEQAVLPEYLDNPRSETLVAAALAAEYNHEAIDPLYLRGSDAEENIEAIAAARGVGLGEAKRMLDAGSR